MIARRHAAHWASRGESIRRRLCERQAAAGLRAPENRATRHGRCQAMRYLTTATRLSWLRLQDTHEILRDGKHPTRQHRRKQDEASSYADGGEKDFTDEAGAADNVRLGDPRTARTTGSLRSPELTLRIVGQSYSPRWRASHRHPCHRERRIRRIYVANPVERWSQRCTHENGLSAILSGCSRAVAYFHEH